MDPDEAWDTGFDLGMKQVRDTRQQLEKLLAAWLSRGQVEMARELAAALEDVEQLCERCDGPVPPGRRWPSYAQPTCHTCLPPPAMKVEDTTLDRFADRVTLWRAVDRYVVACGGDPTAHVYGNTDRQQAVVDVEAAAAQVTLDRDTA